LVHDIVRDVLPIILLTRTLFIALTILIPLWRAFWGVPPLILAHDNGTWTIFDEWNRWDTRWYDDLARLGYNLRGPNDYKNVAFFPLYPLLVRALHDVLAVGMRNVLGFSPTDPWFPPFLVPGLIVSNLCSVAALCFFYALVRLDYDRGTACRAVTLLALFPPSLYMFAAYSEGTFLLCAVAFFYALRLQRWRQAGLWGLLAAVTRPPGAVLLLPFLMAWAQAYPVAAGILPARARLVWRGLLARARVYMGRLSVPTAQPQVVAVAVQVPARLKARPSGPTPRRRARDFGRKVVLVRRSVAQRVSSWPLDLRQALSSVLPALAIPLGLGLFMLALYRMFGDPLWFSHAQKAWWRTFAPPWETLYISVAWPLGDLLSGHLTYWDPYGFHDALYALIGLAVTWYARRHLPRPQVAYLWLMWVALLSWPAMLAERLPDGHTGEPHHDVLMSLPRMMLMLFPLFTFLGLQRRWYPWLAGISTVGLVAYTCIFLTGGWIS
jgi:hypothetical protein